MKDHLLYCPVSDYDKQADTLRKKGLSPLFRLSIHRVPGRDMVIQQWVSKEITNLPFEKNSDTEYMKNFSRVKHGKGDDSHTLDFIIDCKESRAANPEAYGSKWVNCGRSPMDHLNETTTMTNMKELQTVFLETLPEKLEEGKLYISETFGVSKHLCPCGCKSLVVLPFNTFPDQKLHGWLMLRTQDKVTFRPSVGNYQLPCKSHYYITFNKIEHL